jgi:hypothetical protein
MAKSCPGAPSLLQQLGNVAQRGDQAGQGRGLGLHQASGSHFLPRCNDSDAVALRATSRLSIYH